MLALTEIFPIYAIPLLLLGAVKDIILPDPLELKPLLILSFVQLKTEPAKFAVNEFGEIVAPGQTLIFDCVEVIAGVGSTKTFTF